MKIKVIFGFPTIENPRIDITHDFGGILPPPSQGLSLWGVGGWGYPKMKKVIIFGFPTIENPRIYITHYFWWYTF